MENTLPGDFKVTTPKNPLLSQHTVTSKGILVPYNKLQLNPYPNTQLGLFVMTVSPFIARLPIQCTDPSMRLTHQLEKDVGCKVLQFIHTIKITKLLGYKTLWYTNTAAS